MFESLTSIIYEVFRVVYNFPLGVSCFFLTESLKLLSLDIVKCMIHTAVHFLFAPSQAHGLFLRQKRDGDGLVLSTETPLTL